jgi:hypothetical protein
MLVLTWFNPIKLTFIFFRGVETTKLPVFLENDHPFAWYFQEYNTRDLTQKHMLESFGAACRKAKINCYPDFKWYIYNVMYI